MDFADIAESNQENVMAANEEISQEIYLAQAEAEREAEILEKVIDDEVLPSVPRLLQLPQETLVEKTHELKAKGQQLDLLLLKAESYSHFIAENQKRTLSQPRDVAITPVDAKKRKSTSESKSTTKKSKTIVQSEPSDTSLPQDVILTTNGEDYKSNFVQPPNLTGGTLLPYQLDGLQWLLSLWENGLSGILADEMGLGKTIQIISLIAHLRHSNTTGPFLIAGPLATIPNWVEEFHKWLPSCPVIMYHGNKQERERIRLKHLPLANQKSLSFPVVITSFEICMIDRSHLERYTWQYLILDEGHRIKNRNCRLVRELKSIHSVSRLLLTGTPIQNTLEELWSLLNFCCPAIFDDLRVFQAWFGFKNIGKDTKVDDIIGDEQKERVVTKLHEILRPFLLRRVKKDVLLCMPPKREVVVYCGMTSLQREYYVRCQEGTLRDTLMTMGIEGAKDTSQQNPLMNLRKVSNHPFLFGEPKDENGKYLGEANPKILVMASGKFKLLDRILPRLYARKHKVLIFSQMTELLNILEDYVINKGYEYCRLDGSTKLSDRQHGINRFNNDPKVFLYMLSTRAGGLGINLTAADTCIIFDSDWNPHQDSQAQDRCHRIGQSKPVLVYRLLTAGSVEIGMMEKQISKRKLERLAILGGDFRQAGHRSSSQLTLTSLRKLLEDDVKNLSRHISSEILEVKSDCNNASSHDNGASSCIYDISDEELDMIMDRDRLFIAKTESRRTDRTDSLASYTKSTDTNDGNSSLHRVPSPTAISCVDRLSRSCSSQSISLNASTRRSPRNSLSPASAISTSSGSTTITECKSSQKEAPSMDKEVIDHVAGPDSLLHVNEHSKAAHRTLGNASDAKVTYDVCSSIPIEGAMYDIIIEPMSGGVLEGMTG